MRMNTYFLHHKLCYQHYGHEEQLQAVTRIVCFTLFFLVAHSLVT